MVEVFPRRWWLVLITLACLGTGAWSQVTPERLYYGVDRRVPVRVDAPSDFVGELTVRMLDIATGEVLAESAAALGRADLAGLLPDLWQVRTTRHIQLYADEEPLGPPLVVQPMLTPITAALVDPATGRVTDAPGAQPVFEDDRPSRESAERVFTGLRVYASRDMVFETSEGEMVFRPRPDHAPNTVFNLLHLIEGGFYTDVIVHRVVAALPDGRPFVVQFGDPSGEGAGGPGYYIDLEKSGLAHDFGVLSMARAGDPNSNGSQIFVCLSREGTSFLDGRYTAFAELIEGAEVLRRIARSAVGEQGRPLDPPVIRRAFTRDAPGVRPSQFSAASEGD